LDHSNLNKAITQTGTKNYHIPIKRALEGYVSKNFNQSNLHTVIMIHEWWGLNQSITQTAEIFSSKNSIRVFVPDLYKNEAANSAEVIN
jgi:dienelactone hydrolase